MEILDNFVAKLLTNMKAFQYDAYHALVNRVCFSSHHMSVLVMSLAGGSQVKKFEQVSSLGHQMSLAGGPVTVRSHVQMKDQGQGAGRVLVLVRSMHHG